MLNSKKELTPVFYGESSVRILPINEVREGFICFQMHWHERMELIYVVTGTLLLKYGKEDKCIKCGSVVVIPPEKPHCGFAGDGGVSYYTIMFDLPAFYNNTPITERLLRPVAKKNVSFSEATNNPDVINLVNGIIKSREGADEFSPLIEVGKVYELMGLLYRFCLDGKQPGDLLDQRFRDVLNFLNSSFCENITSESLSKKFGYDEAYFCRRFKAVTGLSPMVYIRILRLEKAKKLLGESENTIIQTAASCGFSDAGYFSRCFKRHYGLSPGEYRLCYKNKSVRKLQ